MYKRILVPVDGSPLARRAAEDGIALARTLGAEVVVLMVTEPYQFIFTYAGEIPVAFPDPVTYEAQVKRSAQKHVGAVAKAAIAAGVSCRELIVSAAPAAGAIVAAAKRQKCDLIVIGSHGRGGLGQLLLGSVTSKVLASCHVPVLVHRGRARRVSSARRGATPG
ncbi:MAG: universal stress protein [Burkholderiales bacterium]|nr:universal stress protein [Burkholderiales bacterium]